MGQAFGGFVFVPGPMLLMQMMDPGTSVLAGALCCSTYQVLHTELFPALAAMSFGLNTVTNDEHFEVTCLDAGQTFSSKKVG